MKRKAVSGIMLTLLLTSILTLAFNLQPVRASGTIYIRPDGTIEGTDKIQQDGDIYSFTDNIYDFIVVQRDNIVVDGAGYTLQGTGSGTGIDLSYRSNVIIKNTEIKSFRNGILLDSSLNNTIFGNDITNTNRAGIYLRYSSNNNSIFRNNITANNFGGIWLRESPSYNNISGNNITNNQRGISFTRACNNTVSGNRIADHHIGIHLVGSSNNSISGNNIANNEFGIWLDWSSNNFIYHNFLDNTQQVNDASWHYPWAEPSINVWDDGYPCGGNYWSDHVTVDVCCGINQDEPGSDGIVDEPYVIDDNNCDNYPLVEPWSPVIPATIDIDPDTFNLKSKGKWITAYIQLPEEYGAEDVDATSILLNETISAVLDPKYEFVTNSSEYLVDHNEDGILERMIKFDKAEVISYISESLGFEPADSTEVALTVAGELYDGTPFEGSCVIRAMTPQKKKLKPTLTLIGPWSGAELDAFMPVLRAFEEKTGIDVEYKMYRTEDLISLLPAQFENGTTPGDLIFMWSSRFIEENGQEGHILDVTDLVDETDFLKGTLDPVKVGDTLYGGAYTGKVKPGFWFRKSFFVNNDLTPPTTWAEFLTLLEDIAAIPGIVNPILSGDGVGWPLSDITEHFIATYGGPELHRNLTAGTVAWNTTQIKSIFTDYLIPLLARDFSDPKTWDTYIINWWNGEYGLYFMGSWITRMVDDPTDLGVFSLPEAPGAEGVVAHTDYFFTPAYTEHPKEAKELFKFLASEEAQSIQVAQGGHIATNIHVPLDAYPPVDRQVAEVVQGKEILTDLDDAIGGVFQVTFWNQLKLLWVAPTQLDDVLNAIEAVAP